MDGSYYIRTTYNSSGLINVVYDGAGGTTCLNCNVASTGTLVATAAEASPPSINLVLVPGRTIGGTIADAGGTPIRGVSVSVYSAAGSSVGFGSSNTLGAWTTSGLPAGTYYVRTVNDLGYANQLHAGINCTSCGNLGGTPVTVAAGATTSGITFVLTPGGSISGTVTDASNANAPLGGINVEIYHPNGLRVQRVATSASGVYTARGLSTGNYFVKTSNILGFVDKLHSDISCLGCSATSGTPVAVTGGAVTGSIDFSLVSGGQITGSVTGRADNLPIDGVAINVYTAAGFLVTSVVTNGSGLYRTAGVPAGSYFARTANSRGLIDGLYSGKDCVHCNPTTGTPSVVANGAATSGLDFSLQGGGRIRGRVTLDDKKAPVSTRAMSTRAPTTPRA